MVQSLSRKPATVKNKTKQNNVGVFEKKEQHIMNSSDTLFGM